MVFSSITFLFFFLPLFIVAYFLTPTIRGKNLTTLTFSLLFYAWGEPRFLPLLLGFIAFNAAGARCIDRYDGRARKAALIMVVSVDLTLLAVFKYAGFLAGIVNEVLDPFSLSVPVPHIILPLGISFFTFHCLSYTIDVYRRRFAANRSLVEIALYIALFPQLIAGPIVRYRTIAGQLHVRRHTLHKVAIGARIFIVGLAQKVLIADQVVPLVDAVFDRTAHPSLADAWTGLISYTIQIYFDFAGYSNMAVGLGLVLGFALPRNFRFPYTAVSMTDFWRRWHMSLSSWLRDYLYIPLGGNRCGAARTYRNLWITFLLCGLWHGASWNFVLWGAWHGTFLVVERLGFGQALARAPTVVRWGYTMLAVMGGWVLFRAHDLTAAMTMYAGLIGWHGIAFTSFETQMEAQTATIVPLIAGCVLAVIPRFVSLSPRPGKLTAARMLGDGAWTFCLLAFSMIWIGAGAYSAFLYFRF